MIEVHGLTKRYRDVVAVDDLSFTVSPGRVTGFLGPNGAGKSTTMRMILGLDTPTKGSARVGGRNYRSLAAPLREVGALLDPAALQKSRTARAHLLWIAQAGGIERKRIDEVLELVGLGKAGDKRVGEFSLGMRQRLGIAAALLGDPAVLMLDEPLNGLDPEGIVWVRTLLKGLASEGRTIFLSSHLMNEMEATADHVLVIGKGKLIADVSVHDLVRQGAAAQVSVVSPRAAELVALLEHTEAHIVSGADNELIVSGVDAAEIGELAARHGIALHELTPRRPGLEEAFIHLTRDQVGYRAKEHHGS
ncbi:ABC transporter ATP-binding protein [Allokutzneria albata]|uniref:ABC-2 type transport system ATP-binding protein n=1 Tax=Allokutzneria albata TaxID=211114 RepID=A0A1G9UZ11_ALLAB|nr:ATP-binding cassette domain-containing protein [Allokutzneria albata]SDM65080.1 ABC-2 type transport system ATP-binding protein [Allokutzneria albata]